MLLAAGRPWLGTGVPAILLLGLLLTFWRLSHNNYIDPSSWLPIKNSHTSSITPSTSAHFNGLATSPALRKTIVIGSLSREDTSWVANELPDWERAIYVTDVRGAEAKGALTVPQNKGNEANVYLWHILQHYDDLPDVLVFLHSHRGSAYNGWHIDNAQHSNPLSIQNLHLDAVLHQGFVNLRCTAWPGCPAGLQLNWNETGDVVLPPVIKTVHVMPAAFNIMFPFGLDNPNATANYTTATPPVRPDVIAAPCCAQFAVSKAQILQRPREDYERYHRWLMDSELDSWTSGRVLEYLWHIIFGRPAYYCPDSKECFRSVFGA